MAKTKLLYVEDEPFLARIVQESLESRDFDVTLVRDGREAISAFQKNQPDICVLDVMLPGKDGFTIAREIRKLQPAVPIIFLTAKTQTEDLLHGFEAGGNDYLRKPFSMEELIVRIHNLLKLLGGKEQSKAQAFVHETFPVGQYTFYPQMYELHFAGAIRKLSLRETQLLTMLVKDPGKPVMRKDILLELWGDDSYYNSRNLDVYISRLRDYLSADPQLQIVTIKGVGYHIKIRTS